MWTAGDWLRTPAARLHLVPPTADAKPAPARVETKGESGMPSRVASTRALGRQPSSAETLAPSLEASAVASDLRTPLAGRQAAVPTAQPPAPGGPGVDSRQAYWQDVERCLDLLPDEADGAASLLRQAIDRHLEACADAVCDLWEPVFHALAQPAARALDMRERLERLVLQLFTAVRARDPSEVQALRWLAQFGDHLRAAPEAARRDAWRAVATPGVVSILPQAGHVALLRAGLAADLAPGECALVLSRVMQRVRPAADEPVPQALPGLMGTWLERTASRRDLNALGVDEATASLALSLQAMAGEDDASTAIRQALLERVAQALPALHRAEHRTLSVLAPVCQCLGRALGGLDMVAGARRDLLAFLVQAGGQGLGRAFRRVVQSLVLGGLPPRRVERDAFGQPVADPDAGLPQRRRLVTDILRVLDTADDRALPPQALACAVAGLATALQDGALLHADQRGALRAELEAALLRWKPAHALMAGVGLGSVALNPYGQSAHPWGGGPLRDGKSRDPKPAKAQRAVAGAALVPTARDQLAAGLQAWDDLPGLVDHAGLDDESLVRVAGLRVQLGDGLPWPFGGGDISRLLERLAASHRAPSVQGRIALAVVQDMRQPPSERLFRMARDVILGRWGSTTLAAASTLTWDQWQARHRKSASDGAPDEAGAEAGSPQPAQASSRSDRKAQGAGLQPPTGWAHPEHIEALGQVHSLYDAFEQRLRSGSYPLGLGQGGGVLAFIEQEIDQLMRMDGIPEPVRQSLVERLSVWGTELAPPAGATHRATSQTTQSGGQDE